MTRVLLRTAFGLALATLLTTVALAQGTTSILSGSVHDESGAVIKGAQIVAKNMASGVEFKATSADNGTFSIPALDSGLYSVTASAAGFKQTVLNDVKLDAGTTGSVRISLAVGRPRPPLRLFKLSLQT